MFIRFVSGAIDEGSHVPAGLFRAAFDLLSSDDLSEYEFEALKRAKDWFELYMESPFGYLRYKPRYEDDVQVFARPYGDMRRLF